jgi:hypothetical protein
MYKIVAVGGKVIDTTDSRQTAMEIASNFANANCTFAKVYCGNTLIAIYS